MQAAAQSKDETHRAKVAQLTHDLELAQTRLRESESSASAAASAATAAGLSAEELSRQRIEGLLRDQVLRSPLEC